MEPQKKKIIVALSGNPNSGKTTVFNAITGARQQIANYPGVTVEKKIGRIHRKGQEIEIVDLPGTYSLTAYSLEEIVARDFLVNERPDVVVDIVDASNLDRNLYLAVQFMELGTPLILALNMMDVAEARKILVDPKTLSDLLGVPVVPMVARSNKGIGDLLDKILEVAEENKEWHPAVISYGMDIDQGIEEIVKIIEKSEIYDKKYPARWRALKCLEGDRQISDLLKRDPPPGEQIQSICDTTYKHTMNTLEEDPEGIIADHRYGFIAGITKKAVKRRIELRLNLSDKIDKVLTNRVVGPIFMAIVLYAIYAFTFWVSEVPLAWVEALFDAIRDVVSFALPEGILKSMVISGIIDGVGGVLSFVPLIMFMFFSIAILEDSGYIARIAYMLDRVLRWFGLHGNSVMALIVSGGISGGCAVPGIMATRTLRDPKERLATLMVVPFMNCGAKLPVYAMLIAAFFSKYQARMMFILTILSWAFALFAAKLMRSTILRGAKTPFVMELPPYRLPTMKGLLIHTWERTWHYIKKAGTVILAFSILLWAMMTFPGLPDEVAEKFEKKRYELVSEFLSNPLVQGLLSNRGQIEDLNSLYTLYENKKIGDEVHVGLKPETARLVPLVEAAIGLKNGNAPKEAMDTVILKAAYRYLDFRERLDLLVAEKQQAALERTIAGRMGIFLEKITAPLGFDYKTNIALIGGFAAKEVVISTLGTAYSLGEVEADETLSLSQKLRENPEWDPLLAFTLIVFIMLYVPCFVTLICIKKESSLGWAVLSVVFNLFAAYIMALVIRQGGLALGIGV